MKGAEDTVGLLDWTVCNPFTKIEYKTLDRDAAFCKLQLVEFTAASLILKAIFT